MKLIFGINLRAGAGALDVHTTEQGTGVVFHYVNGELVNSRAFPTFDAAASFAWHIERAAVGISQLGMVATFAEVQS